MRMRDGLVVSTTILLLFAASGPAIADECEGATTQMALDACAGAAFHAADAVLNRTYQITVDRLRGDAPARSLLAAAERAWIGFRDAQCDFEGASTVGGSVHPMVVTQCRTTMTRQRTQALRRLLSCTEGDLACPLPPH